MIESAIIYIASKQITPFDPIRPRVVFSYTRKQKQLFSVKTTSV